MLRRAAAVGSMPGASFGQCMRDETNRGNHRVESVLSAMSEHPTLAVPAVVLTRMGLLICRTLCRLADGSITVIVTSSSPFLSWHTFQSPRTSFFAAWIRRCLVCTLASATPLIAQQMETVTVGVRDRLTLRDSVCAQPFTRQTTPLIGTVISSTANDFTLAVGARDPVRITRPSIRSVQISRGASRRRSAIARGIKGEVVGTLRRGEASERVLGAAIGTGLGVVIGLLSPFEHWRSFRC